MASPRLRDATLPSMGKTHSAQLFILYHHVGARVRADRRSRSGRARRACHLEETPPRRPTARPVASPAQWSPGSSPDLWCKSFIYSLWICCCCCKHVFVRSSVIRASGDGGCSVGGHRSEEPPPPPPPLPRKMCLDSNQTVCRGNQMRVWLLMTESINSK